MFSALWLKCAVLPWQEVHRARLPVTAHWILCLDETHPIFPSLPPEYIRLTYSPLGLYIPFFHITEFASSKAGLNENLAFYMLPILSAGSIIGRIFPSYVADHTGPLNVLGICTIIAGVLGFCWIAIQHTLGGLIVWALLYGAFSGAFVSLQPSTVVSITDDMSIVGGRLGMNTFCAALGILIGNPIAGIIVGKSWIGLQCFCGGTLLAGAVMIMITRWSRVGWAVVAKA